MKRVRGTSKNAIPSTPSLTRRRVLALAAGALGAAAVPALRPASTSAAASPSKTVSILDVPINDDLTKQADGVFSKYTQTTGIQVQVDRVPYPEWPDKVITLLNSGAPPDTYWADPAKYPEYVEKGWLEPLDDYIAGSKVIKKDEFLPTAWEKVTYKGKIYGLPKDWSVRGAYYNEDLFNKLKITKVPETVEELKQTALEVKSKDPSLFGYMWPMKTPDTWMFEGLAPIMLPNEAAVVSADGTRSTFNSPAMAETYQFFVDIWKAKAAPEQGMASTNQDLYPLFGGSKVAMMQTGFFVIKAILPKIGPDHYNTFVVKGRGGHYGTPMSVSAFSIPAQAKNKDGAWALLEWMYRPENITAFLVNPSARKPDAPENATRFTDPRYKPFFLAAQEGGKWWITPNPGITDQMRIVLETSQAIVLGQKTIPQGLADGAAAIQKTLKS
ncbi:MAG TPA: sugar ABC transporter substrate-binding protein [bacterium]|nr:sugar ABC transporter substrate-binding protein [bacterium]